MVAWSLTPWLTGRAHLLAESLSTGCALLKDFLGLHEVAVDLVPRQVVVGIAQIIWCCVLVLALQVLGSQQLAVCQPHIRKAGFSSSWAVS